MASDSVWRLIQAEYAAGKTPKELSGKFGIAAKTISNRASIEGWREDRATVGKILADETPRAIASRLVATAADYVAQHIDDTQALRLALMKALDPDATDEDRQRASFALVALKAYKDLAAVQRTALGLDRKEPDPPPDGGQGKIVIPAKDLEQMPDDELGRMIEGELQG